MKRILAAHRIALLALLGIPLLSLAAASPVQAEAKDYFRIDIQDEDTGRGVPLVELRTTNNIRFYTDSNGIVAINDPDLLGQKIYFHIKSHGYTYPADGFGYHGIALQVVPGKRTVIKIKRVNIAERLYRITGAGIYRDSLLVGESVPVKQPLINGQVMGQDTVEVTPYHGKLYWFWGDTDQPSYPLGLFQTPGATSLLPGKGGLNPAKGIDLAYHVDKKTNFVKAMIPLQPALGGPIWIAGLFTLNDGQERLITHYSHLDGSGKTAEQGLAIFNDDKAIFEKRLVYDLNGPLNIDGHPFHTTVGRVPYLYFPTISTGSFYLCRVQEDMAHVTDPHKYEAFTCLMPGARYEKENTRLERFPDGRLIWGWKADTAPLSHGDEKQLIDAGKMKQDERLVQLRDIETGESFQPHGGSTYWNPYRKRWVMLVSQAFGKSSYLGELWFAEADTPVGPWVYARKILTHEKYTFYNPTQHPFFDQEGGRIIYFEGTYTDTYSGNEDKTPRYNYNQIMYRLTLDDSRLSLPTPVYHFKGTDYGVRESVAASNRWSAVQDIPFYAVPPERTYKGLIPIYSAGAALQTAPATGAKPLFYALPAIPAQDEKPSPDIVPLYEYKNTQSGEHWYATDAEQSPTVTHSTHPLCRVWRNPSRVLTLDFTAQPVSYVK